ncbi:FAD/NAD(P)-binding protein [Pseudomonas sp. CFII68]|uniref:FAD/NAD(P)-binding protein n=1 Tax=Pseudomonas sp. CFII68 TaxID=911243 RepID=UPI0004066274|nr:FAD/NAD(P)-binding protein [Pseudomonas sp. CFII68]
MRILQVGAGPTGVSLFIRLHSQLETQYSVLEYVIADGRKPGSGLAFGTGYNSHLINLPASVMSINPDNPLEFVEWRAKNQSLWQEYFPDEEQAWSEFPSRRLFGLYVGHQLQRALNGASFAELINTSVSCVTPIQSVGKFSVEFSNGTKEIFDKVIICIGHAPRFPLLSNAPQKFFCSPYQAMDIPIHATVGIIGSRLTAIDAALALQEKGHIGRITMVSRTGKLPKVIAEHSGYDPSTFITALLNEKNQTLESILTHHKKELDRVTNGLIDWDALAKPGATRTEELEREISSCSRGNHLWQSVLLASYSVIDKLWARLSDPEKAEFMTKYYGPWMTYLAAFPVFSAVRILQLMQGEQLEIYSDLQGVEATEQGFDIYHGRNECLNVQYLIDGRGVGYGEMDLKEVPLLKNMLANGSITTHPLGGVSINSLTYQALSNRHNEIPGLFVVGDLTKGEFLATTDVVRNVMHSVAASSAILSRNR